MREHPLQRASHAAASIRRLAREAHTIGQIDPATVRILRRVDLRPIDYMRWAEFEAILMMLDLTPGQVVLDVASPQWFSLYLAHRYPDVRIIYINILESEVDPYRFIASVHKLNNVTYETGDVRCLRWRDASFDKVISISVVEHIFPETGGDDWTLLEIGRVLRDRGQLLITVPCKATAGTVYVEGPVYERPGVAPQFFAREYDMESFHDLIHRGGFVLDEQWRIEERTGAFALDYWEWGDGKHRRIWSTLVRRRSKVERLIGRSFDEALAKRYLDVCEAPHGGRLVNVAARLQRPSRANN